MGRKFVMVYCPNIIFNYNLLFERYSDSLDKYLSKSLIDSLGNLRKITLSLTYGNERFKLSHLLVMIILLNIFRNLNKNCFMKSKVSM